MKTLAMFFTAAVLAALERRPTPDDRSEGFALFVGSARAIPVPATSSTHAPRTGLR